MSVETVLARLDRVTQKSDGEYRASCPTDAHKFGNRSAGLCITVLGNGKTLLYCPAGCTADEITASVGLQLSDLFPPRDSQTNVQTQGLPEWKRKRLKDALDLEWLVLQAFHTGKARGKSVSKQDTDRADLASRRFKKLAGVLHE